MPSLFDEALAANSGTPGPESEVGARPPSLTKFATKKGVRDLKAEPYVTGNLAVALGPTSGSKQKAKSLVELLDEEDQKIQLGYTKATRHPVIPKEEADQIDEKPTLFDEALATDLGVAAAVVARERKKGQGFVGEALKVLSIDENLIVKGISRAFGLNEKPDLSDYTYSNLLKDLGAPDAAKTDAIGFALSIFGSPSTYLTLGTAPIGKVALKEGAVNLSNKGLKVAAELAKERTAIAVAAAQAKAAKHGRKGELSNETVTRIADRSRQEVAQEMSDYFKLVSRANDETKAGRLAAKELKKIPDEIRALPKDVIDRGGVKFELPGFLATSKLGRGVNTTLQVYEPASVKLLGVPVMKGWEVAKEAVSTGLEPVTRAVKAAYDPISQTPLAKKMTGSGKDLADFLEERVFQKGRRLTNEVKDILGKTFLYGYKQDQAILELTDHYHQLSQSLKDRVWKRTAQWFNGMDKAATREFSEKLIQASVKADEASRAGQKIAKARILSDNPLVQDRLDRWLGFGKYVGRVPLQERIAKWSTLIEEDPRKLTTWFPGVIAHELPSFKLKTVGGLAGTSEAIPAAREFLRARVKDKSGNNFASKYTRNPVFAIAHRRLLATYANLQDKMWKNAIDQRLGGVRKFESPELAETAGYKEFKPPRGRYLMGEDSDRVIYTQQQDRWYAPKEFVDNFDSAITHYQPYIPLLSDFTSLFKQSVTALPIFPAFFARNINSNIVLNAYSIGMIQTLKYQGLALDMVRGKNLDRVLTTETGAKIKLSGLLDEMKKHGVFRGSSLKHDLGGEALDDEARSVWHLLLGKANPLSLEFAPAMWGRKLTEAIDDQARAINYLHWRMRGVSPKIAADEAREALLDYAKLTKSEKWANEFLLFYTFSKKNLERHIRLLASDPSKVVIGLKAFRDFGPKQKEWDNDLPDYAKKRFVARLKGSFFAGFSPPLEDVIDFLDDPTGNIKRRLTPPIQYGLEQEFGVEFFSGRRLEEANSAKEFAGILTMSQNKDLPMPIRATAMKIANFLELERDPSNPKKVIGSPDKLHILRKLPTSRAQSLLADYQDTEKDALWKSMEWLLGIYKIEPNPQLKSSIAFREESQKMTEMSKRENLFRTLNIPAPYGGDPASRELYNEMLSIMHPRNQLPAAAVKKLSNRYQQAVTKMKATRLENREKKLGQ